MPEYEGKQTFVFGNLFAPVLWRDLTHDTHHNVVVSSDDTKYHLVLDLNVFWDPGRHRICLKVIVLAADEKNHRLVPVLLLRVGHLLRRLLLLHHWSLLLSGFSSQ